MNQRQRIKRRKRIRRIKRLVWVVVIIVLGGTFYYLYQQHQVPEETEEIIVDSYDDIRIPDKLYKWETKAIALEAIRVEQEKKYQEERQMDLVNYFSKDLFIGDSITEALSYYKLLNPENVYAEIGINMTTLQDRIDHIIHRSPERIFILMGTNDLANKKPIDTFIQEYETFIEMIREELPGTEIIVQSVLPLTESGYASHPNISPEGVQLYNEAIAGLEDEEEGVFFLDLSQLFTDSSFFEPDGIHFVYGFYGEWLEYIRQWEQDRSDQDEKEALEAYRHGGNNFVELTSLWYV